MASDRHPDATRVELTPRQVENEIADDVLCEVHLDADGRAVAVRVAPSVAPKAPPMWFAELRENTARPPAVNLLVFTGAGQRPGALVDRSALRELPVTSDDQLGALRWYPATGEIDQIYVQPAWRRRSIATALLVAAGSLGVSRGWARLWSDGQRTRDGEALRAASAWAHRAADLTHIAPPMTPGDAPD